MCICMEGVRMNRKKHEIDKREGKYKYLPENM